MRDTTSMTTAELQAYILELEAKTKRNTPGLSMKIGEKGGISVYGTGRFPTTNYAETWVKLLVYATGLPVDQLKDTPMVRYIVENQHLLSFKNGILELGIKASAQAAE